MRDWTNAGAYPSPRRIYRGHMPNPKQTVSVSVQEFQKLNDKLDLLIERQKNNEIAAASRAHLDGDIVEVKKLIEGNGKPGFNAIRDRVLSWDAKLTSLSMLVLGDIVFRVFTLIYSK